MSDTTDDWRAKATSACARMVVIGGGIAGVSCAQSLLQLRSKSRFPCMMSTALRFTDGSSIASNFLMRAVCVADEVLLISASSQLKMGRFVKSLGKLMHEVDVVEVTPESISAAADDNESSEGDCLMNRLQFVEMIVESVDVEQNLVMGHKGSQHHRIPYERLCICSGAVPQSLPWRLPQIHAIRDTDSVDELMKALAHSTRIAIVGNGG